MMCEQMGWEPNEDEIPKDPGSLPIEVQSALILFNILPDKIEGMSGTWLGKDFAALETIMNIYEIENRREVLDYILIIQREYSDYYHKQQKMKESSSRAKGRR